MIEVYDIEDSSFLKEYENDFMQENYKTNNQYSTALKNMPQYLIEGKDYIKKLISNYDNVFYPEWKRVLHRSYVFKFEPDKPTMVPHIDIDPQTCSIIKGMAKRVILYVNPYWDKKWGGGTYFAPFEKYKATEHYTAKVPRKKFAEEAQLVNNVPGRIIVFDPDEWHMPQEFSGSTVQRLLYSFAIVHPNFSKVIGDIEKKAVTPDNINGFPVASLDETSKDGHKRSFVKKNDVVQHVDSRVVDWIIKDIK